MSNLEAHSSQDILATLPSQSDVLIPVSVTPSLADEGISNRTKTVSSVQETHHADIFEIVQEQLADPLLQLETVVPESTPVRRATSWGDRLRFALHYACISAIIFVILLGTLNWHAYSALARAWWNPQELENAQKSIDNVLSASAISENTTSTGTSSTVSAPVSTEQDAQKDTRRAVVLEERLKQDKVVLKREWLSAKTFLRNSGDMTYNVEIAPYDNRVIIPKLGKNIPLVNVDNHKVGNPKDWNSIFETELEKGIIKYPGSANPGDIGNSFIFGHSSNFPWIKGDYNDVFALLDKLEYGDEITVYFKQKKYVYVIREKHIIKPGYVNAMKGKEESKQLTLMTCWPVGTTLNRLIVMGELKSENPSPTENGVALRDGNLISMK